MPDSAPPRELPVFPLTGVLLLPGMPLPLHIFEPRYRALLEDALAGARHIGMIQPVQPRQDNQPPPGAERDQPPLYKVGCAGRIAQSERMEDGRYVVALHGVTRFRVAEELPLHRGYRRVSADYAPFAQDLQPAQPVDTSELLAGLQRYGQGHGLNLDWERLRELPDPMLINGLAMSLPFAPAEKQALLEAPGLSERQALLNDLLRAPASLQAQDPFTPPLVN